MARTARPEDLASFVVPTDPNLSPDGRTVAFVAQTTTARRDGYRHAIWAAPADGSAPGPPAHDRVAPRRLPPLVAGRRDPRVHLGPPHGGRGRGRRAGEARGRRPGPPPAGRRRRGPPPHGPPARGRRLRLVARRDAAGGRELVAGGDPGGGRSPPAPAEGRGAHRPAPERLPLHGPARVPVQRTRLPRRPGGAALGRGRRHRRRAPPHVRRGRGRGAPPGRRTAGASRSRPTATRVATSAGRADIWVVDADDPAPRPRRVTGGSRHWFGAPAWLPDGRRIAALGHRYPVSAGARSDVWIFAADGSEAARRDEPHGAPRPDDRRRHQQRRDDRRGPAAPRDRRRPLDPLPRAGSRLAGPLAARRRGRATWSASRRAAGRSPPRTRRAGGEGLVVAAIRCSATELPEVCAGLLGGAAGKAKKGDAADGKKKAKKGADGLALRPVTDLNGPAVDGLALSAPVEMTWTVDGRTIQGWWYPPLAADGSPAPLPGPLVLQIHGGPMTAYGHAPFWEWQVLAGAGMGVLAANPRGSDGYGQAFAQANVRDWGAGPTADLLAGVDILVADGRADAARLGVTGGSYGGYLTSWIVGPRRPLRRGDHLPLGERPRGPHGDGRHRRPASSARRTSAPSRGRIRRSTASSRRSRTRRRSGPRSSSSTRSRTSGRRSRRPSCSSRRSGRCGGRSASCACRASRTSSRGRGPRSGAWRTSSRSATGSPTSSSRGRRASRRSRRPARASDPARDGAGPGRSRGRRRTEPRRPPGAGGMIRRVGASSEGEPRPASRPPVLPAPELPALLRRSARLADRHVDAVGRAGLARPHPDEQPVRPRPRRRGAVRPRPLPRPVRRGRRRLAPEAPDAHRDPDRDDGPRLRPRRCSP